MSATNQTLPLIDRLYSGYLEEVHSATFIQQISRNYSPGTLEQITATGSRISRRAAVLALGFAGNYSSNEVLGKALHDPDRAVRVLAENSIRSIWRRAAGERLRRELSIVSRSIVWEQYNEAVARVDEIIVHAPTFAEAWNQRGIAHYGIGHFDLSIRDCQQTLELNPFHFGAAAGIGICYLEEGDLEAALESFRQALDVNPGLEGVSAQIDHLQRTLGHS